MSSFVHAGEADEGRVREQDGEPLPLVEAEDKRIGGWARSRLQLTPGITGSWQVLGRTTITFEEMVKLDYLYVTNWSLWSDVRLILRTFPALMTRRGAN